MKKNKFFTIISFALFLISSSAFSQNAYYDAIRLRALGLGNKNIDGTNIIDIPEKDPIINILSGKTYCGSITDLQEAYKDNPFMQYITGSHDLGTPDNNGVGLSSIGGLDVTNFAQGLAQFMIKRAKQELTIAFFNRFQKFITDSNYREVQILFPKTADIIVNLLSYQYPQMLPTLRSAFNEDLQNLPFHLAEVLRLPRYKHLVNSYPQIGLMVGSLSIIQGMQNGDTNVAEIIKQFAGLDAWNAENSDKSFINIKNGFGLAKIFSESLRDSVMDHDNPWISSKELNALISDKITFQIYLGLIYQQVKTVDIKFILQSGTVHFAQKMEDNFDNIKFYHPYLNKFISMGEKIDGMIKEIKHKKELYIQITNEDTYNYIKTGIDAIELTFDFAKIFDSKIELNTSPYLSITRQGNELYKNIYKKEYSLAVINSLDILQNIIDLSSNNKKVKRDKLLADLNGDGTSVVLNKLLAKKKIKNFNYDKKKLDKILDKIEKDSTIKISVIKSELYKFLKNADSLELADNTLFLNKLLTRLSKYGLFIANIVEAKTPEEVSNVIENAALPVGSSSYKKYHCGNVSINGYLGANYNYEVHKSPNNAWQKHFNVTAPVGINVSFASIGKGGAFSAFVPLIDIGAIVNSQLTKDSSGIDQKIYLRNIFSPGFYLVYGCGGNLPLSFGCGAQYGPGLYKMGTDPLNPSWRFNAFLAVDIPMFNIIKGTKIHDPKVKSKKKK